MDASKGLEWKMRIIFENESYSQDSMRIFEFWHRHIDLAMIVK